MTQWYQAREPFTIELNGAPHAVAKGKTLPEDDPIVKHDLKHGGTLFAPLDMGEPEPKPKPSAAHSATSPITWPTSTNCSALAIRSTTHARAAAKVTGKPAPQ